MGLMLPTGVVAFALLFGLSGCSVFGGKATEAQGEQHSICALVGICRIANAGPAPTASQTIGLERGRSDRHKLR